MALNLASIVSSAFTAAGNAVSGVVKTLTYTNVTTPTYTPSTGLYSGGTVSYTLRQAIVLSNNSADTNENSALNQKIRVMVPSALVTFTPTLYDSFTVPSFPGTWKVSEITKDPTGAAYYQFIGTAA